MAEGDDNLDGIDKNKDDEARDKEIAELKQTLQDITAQKRSHQQVRKGTPQRRRATSLQMESGYHPVGEQDYVPDHLVTPILHATRPKIKGIHKMVADDIVDKGKVVQCRSSNIVERRQSDPGNISYNLLSLRQRKRGSLSSSDDEDYSRSPGSVSPRRQLGSRGTEDECYPMSSFVPVDGKHSPGWASPHRRLYPQKHSTCGTYSPVRGDESPQIRSRRPRANSLPLATFWPDVSSLEIGEALGALAIDPSKEEFNRYLDSDITYSKNLVQISQVNAVKRLVNRCLSTDDQPLEAIMEEAGSRSHTARRFSVPQSLYSTGYTYASSNKAFRVLP